MHVEDAEFAALVDGLGRIIVDHGHPVPMDVAAVIAGRARWLRKTVIPALDEELELTFPLVVVKRVCWLNELGDGTGGIVKGRVGPYTLGDGRRIWAIEISAVLLLEYLDTQVTGTLAHEFLHYVWKTLRSRGGGDLDLDLTTDAYDFDNKHYRRRDAEVAADPDVALIAADGRNTRSACVPRRRSTLRVVDISPWLVPLSARLCPAPYRLLASFGEAARCRLWISTSTSQPRTSQGAKYRRRRWRCRPSPTWSPRMGSVP